MFESPESESLGNALSPPAFQLQAGEGFASAAGAPPLESESEPVQRNTENALLGAATGAAVGAGIGSMVPAVGTTIGGIVGGLVGGVAGALIGNNTGLRDRINESIANGGDYAAIRTLIQGGTAEERAVALADQTLLRAIQNHLGFGDFARTVESLGRTAPDYNSLIANPVVTAAINTAWTASSPAINPPVVNQHEEGGWVFLNLVTGAVTTRAQASGGMAAINLSNPPIVPDSVVIGKYHTHPNLGPGWNPRPSPGDIAVDAQHGVPDIVIGSINTDISTTDLFLSGPARRTHLGGGQGFPGAGGGIAPQAKSDGSYDEQ